jgi:hypothetical protein
LQKIQKVLDPHETQEEMRRVDRASRRKLIDFTTVKGHNYINEESF